MQNGVIWSYQGTDADPGPIRIICDQDKKFIGIICHAGVDRDFRPANGGLFKKAVKWDVFRSLEAERRAQEKAEIEAKAKAAKQKKNQPPARRKGKK